MSDIVAVEVTFTGNIQPAAVEVEIRVPGVSVSQASLPATIHAAAAKTTPALADELAIVDSAAAWILKKMTFSALKTWIQSFAGGGSGLPGTEHATLTIGTGTSEIIYEAVAEGSAGESVSIVHAAATTAAVRAVADGNKITVTKGTGRRISGYITDESNVSITFPDLIVATVPVDLEEFIDYIASDTGHPTTFGYALVHGIEGWTLQKGGTLGNGISIWYSISSASDPSDIPPFVNYIDSVNAFIPYHNAAGYPRVSSLSITVSNIIAVVNADVPTLVRAYTTGNGSGNIIEATEANLAL